MSSETAEREFTGTYEVTAPMQVDSVRSYYFHACLMPKAWRIVLMLALMPLAVWIMPFHKLWLASFFAAMLAFIALSWWRAFRAGINQALTGLAVMEHPRVEVVMDDQGILYSSSTGTRRHQWDKIRRIVETPRFVILMNGNLPLLSLPKEGFSGEALEFIRRKSWIDRKD